MTFYSPTQKREWLRCPRRYFYRYIFQPTSEEESSAHQARRQLYGIRELGGHLIHCALADMVRDWTSNGCQWTIASATQSCLETFEEAINASLKTGPGRIHEGLQLAETYNGLVYENIKNDVAFWTRMIPRAIANGETAARTIGIPPVTAMVQVEAEKEVYWQSASRPRRIIFDVLIRTPYRMRVIDWKCHAIDNVDLDQLTHYLRYLHKFENPDELSLVGRAVDLFSGEYMEVTYKPHLPVVDLLESSHVRHIPKGEKKPPSFDPAPDPELCPRCPYSDLCESSVARLQSAAS
ncbi:MAG TPA: PD-(D/E)XK nuclease family protein [Candidatus Methylacidiphilales bacterium]|nr:PD-(D/E)XK nuclease family protein [Candidatus Methylacidiphilales bacterium]